MQALLYKVVLEGELSTLHHSFEISKKRNHLYRCFVFAEHGTLGRRVCIHIPECVVSFIHRMCPNANNIYTGHQDIDEDGNKLPDTLGRNNQSFELVLLDSIHGHTDFAGGEKVKICVSFENNNNPITNVWDFVNQSPVEG